MESLTDRRWDPRLAEEKSRNSSTQEGLFWVTAGVVVGGAKVSIEGIFCRENSGQLGVIFGILGGNCAIAQRKAQIKEWIRKLKTGENGKMRKLEESVLKMRML